MVENRGFCRKMGVFRKRGFLVEKGGFLLKIGFSWVFGQEIRKK